MREIWEGTGGPDVGGVDVRVEGCRYYMKDLEDGLRR